MGIYVLAVFVKSAEAHRGNTWGAIWEVLAWSFERLYNNEHPRANDKGEV